MSHRLYIFILVIIAGIIYGKYSFGQEITYRQFLRVSGNQPLNVGSITKDNKNFIWLTTQEGVFRYDGKSFLKVNQVNTQTGERYWQSGNLISYNPEADQLIAHSIEKGISVLDYSSDSLQFLPVELPEKFQEDRIVRIEAIHDGFVVTTISSSFFGKIVFNSGKQIPKLEFRSKALDEKILISRRIDQRDWLVLTDSKELLKFKVNKDFSLTRIYGYSVSSELKGGSEYFALDENRGAVYLGADNGLIMIQNAASSAPGVERLLGTNVVYALTHTTDGSEWIAADDGLYRMAGKEFSALQPANTYQEQFNLDAVYAIFPGNDDLVWLGTQGGLTIAVNKPPAFFAVTRSADRKDINHAYQMGLAGNGSVYVSAENGLYEFTREKKFFPLITGQTFFLNFPGPENTHILSGLTGTFILKEKKLIPIQSRFPEFSKYPGLSFNDYTCYQDSLIYLSTENNLGVYKWNYKKGTLIKLDSGTMKIVSQTNGLYRFKEDLFILTDSSIVHYNLKNKAARKFELSDLKGFKPYGLYFDMLRMGSNYLIASYGNGIICTDTSFTIKRLFAEEAGLSSNGVYRILARDDSSIFISTNNGINLLNIYSGDIIRYLEEDGLHGNSFEEMSSLYADRKMYFGGKGGITLLDPARIVMNRGTAPVYFTECIMTDVKTRTKSLHLLNKQSVEIPSAVSSVNIHFQCLLYPSAGRVNYSYRIQGINNGWVSNGEQHFISITGIKPGKYNLEIIATQDGKSWTDPISLHLTFLPKWYQTIWFKLAVALAVLSLLYGFYRYRINQIRKQEQIRREIAGDLHDDIGSTLNSIKVFSNLALMMPEKKEYLEQIKTGAQNAITSVRDLIWVLDDQLDSISDVLNRFEQFATPLAKANGIYLVREIDNNLSYRNLSKKEKRNFYLILKESFNNCVKYAACNEFRYGFVLLKPEKLVLKAEDNGTGFELTNNGGGNGLKNMRERARQMGYSFSIHSSPEKGTGIIISKN